MDIEPVEERSVVARIVPRFELGRIEIAVGSRATDRQEISDGVSSTADVRVKCWALERSVAEGKAAGRLRLIEAGLGHDMHDQTALVAVLRRRDAGYQFHGLDRVRRDLI